VRPWKWKRAGGGRRNGAEVHGLVSTRDQAAEVQSGERPDAGRGIDGRGIDGRWWDWRREAAKPPPDPDRPPRKPGRPRKPRPEPIVSLLPRRANPETDAPRTVQPAPPSPVRVAWMKIVPLLTDARNSTFDDIVFADRTMRKEFLDARRDWRKAANALCSAIGDPNGALLARLRDAIGVEFIEPEDIDGAADDPALIAKIDAVNETSEWLAFCVTQACGGWAARD
jgi:hypothetical protein